MAKTGERNDPCLAFRFEVRIDDLPPAGFSECAGLQLETEVQDYAEGGVNDHVLKFPTRTKQSNLTLKRGVVDRRVWDWFFDCARGRLRFRDGSVLVHDPAGEQPAAVWRFKQGFPCKWSGPDLNAGQSSVAVETVEICHQGLERDL